MANKTYLKKRYGSPALANLMGRPMIAKVTLARIKVIKTKVKPLPTYRGSFSVKKK